MKKTLFVICLFSATAAFAQYGAPTISNQVRSYQFESHPAHADYAQISSGASILGGATYGFAQGDRPASDFAQADAVSLGTFAREFRKEHAAEEKKSRVVWINQ